MMTFWKFLPRCQDLSSCLLTRHSTLSISGLTIFDLEMMDLSDCAVGGFAMWMMTII